MIIIILRQQYVWIYLYLLLLYIVYTEIRLLKSEICSYIITGCHRHRTVLRSAGRLGDTVQKAAVLRSMLFANYILYDYVLFHQINKPQFQHTSGGKPQSWKTA